MRSELDAWVVYACKGLCVERNELLTLAVRAPEWRGLAERFIHGTAHPTQYDMRQLAIANFERLVRLHHSGVGVTGNSSLAVKT